MTCTYKHPLPAFRPLGLLLCLLMTSKFLLLPIYLNTDSKSVSETSFPYTAVLKSDNGRVQLERCSSDYIGSLYYGNQPTG